MTLTDPLHALIEQLQQLPGIGPKSAQRLAYFFLSLPADKVHQFAQVLEDTRERVRYCSQCFTICFDERCGVCTSESRNQSTICIVADPRTVYAMERIGEYNGVYHVLGGLISPIDGIHPELLRIQELMDRIRAATVTELILAINPTVEGDATVLYLQHILKHFPIRITRLAYGLPMGADIDYADDLTLLKAFQGRTRVEE